MFVHEFGKQIYGIRPRTVLSVLCGHKIISGIAGDGDRVRIGSVEKKGKCILFLRIDLSDDRLCELFVQQGGNMV